MLTLGIVGNGFVGRAARGFGCESIRVLVYDIVPDLCVPKGLTLNDMSQCDLIFIAVPTPMGPSGECHTSIVEKVIADLKPLINTSKTHLVVRSTVPPGFSEDQRVHFMPEFLTERGWKEDFYNQPVWYFGLSDNTESNTSFQLKAQTLIDEAFKGGKIKSRETCFVANGEAEMLKYTKNTFLATKISFFNEIASLCEAKGINFERVRKMVVTDPRISDSHTMVPGHDGRRGFGGTCLPKDLSAICHVFDTLSVPSYVLKSAKQRNDIVDRPTQDWHEKGRSVI